MDRFQLICIDKSETKNVENVPKTIQVKDVSHSINTQTAPCIVTWAHGRDLNAAISQVNCQALVWFVLYLFAICEA